MSRARVAWFAAGAAALLLTAVPFFTATTFHGDDHLFLTFARHGQSPLVPFHSDQHGGEYYRPLPMAIWWLLGRSGGGQPLFAATALLSHAAAALLLGRLIIAIGRSPEVAAASAALMFLAPQNLEGAYWFSASTDLFATVFVLAAALAAVRGRPVLSAAAALAAYLSKETAYVLPALSLVLVRSLPPSLSKSSRRYWPVLLQLAALAVILPIRTMVLGGWGSGADERAAPLGKAAQMASGVLHVFVGSTALPEPVAFGTGAAVLALALHATFRRKEAGRWRPFLLCAIALSPLVAAGWAVGARYYYLPAVGLAWGVAEVLASTGPAFRVMAGLVLLGLGLVQAGARRPDVVSYQRRVEAARRAVQAGLASGHRLFHVDGGVKDLDLAVKNDPGLASASVRFLVLADVPASFAIVPPELLPDARMFIADPPLPPRGAYEFGRVRVVGLARRGDEPSLDEVLSRFPDLRFIRLRAIAGGQVIGRDRTDEVKRSLDVESGEGQNPD